VLTELPSLDQKLDTKIFIFGDLLLRGVALSLMILDSKAEPNFGESGYALMQVNSNFCKRAFFEKKFKKNLTFYFSFHHSNHRLRVVPVE